LAKHQIKMTIENGQNAGGCGWSDRPDVTLSWHGVGIHLKMPTFYVISSSVEREMRSELLVYLL